MRAPEKCPKCNEKNMWKKVDGQDSGIVVMKIAHGLKGTVRVIHMDSGETLWSGEPGKTARFKVDGLTRIGLLWGRAKKPLPQYITFVRARDDYELSWYDAKLVLHKLGGDSNKKTLYRCGKCGFQCEYDACTESSLDNSAVITSKDRRRIKENNTRINEEMRNEDQPRFRLIAIVGLVVAIFAYVLITSVAGSEVNVLGFSIIVFIGLLICGLVDRVVGNPSMVKKSQEVSTICRIEGDTLYVHEQSPAFSEVAVFRKYKLVSYEYNPEKIHFGAVTVGGVTTGGVYKTGGDHTKSNYEIDKYELVYTVYGKESRADRYIVSKIVISDSLKEKAENSPIAKYLKGNEIAVVHYVDASSDIRVRELLKMGHSAEAINLMKMLEAKGLPDREKADIISSFLCGN